MSRTLITILALFLLVLSGCADATVGDLNVPDDDDTAEDDDDSVADDDDSSGDDDDSAGDDDDSSGDDDDSTGDDDDSTGDDDDTAEQPVDADGDGHTDDVDCNDGDPAIHPLADELCDGTDHNCDGDSLLGAIDAPTWYEDTDGDGYGVDSSPLESCFQPHSYSAYSGDCDDTNPSYHPGAAETDCTDPNDYNCDQSTGFADVDGDTHAACEDCDDNNDQIHPAATESCNQLDDDCDGQVDEAGATGESTWYLDADGDSYGRLTWTETSCDQPTGFADNGDDCDDLDATSYPGATEVCDGADNNCTAGIDEGVTTTFFGDSDGDGYGDAGSPISACFLPPGSSVNNDDCDDGSASSHPGGLEVCDTLDNDCDTFVDENALDATTWYIDADDDGYGNPLTGTVSCTTPADGVANGLDCDDDPATGADNFPGNPETCDGNDQNCNSAIDEGFDSDGDGVTTCGLDGSLGTADDDCNDGDPDLFPGNPELCDAIDQDCDLVADNGVDGDGDIITSWGADGITGTTDDDCDDSDGDNFPNNPEVCDGQDNNCDTIVDEGFDGDNDTYTTCGADGFTGSNDDDCDDDPTTGPGIHPNAAEICDAIDQDCDGAVDEGFDQDSDGFTTCGADGIAGTTDDDCDDTTSGQGFNGSSSACPTVSCKLLIDNFPGTPSGPRWLDPESDGNPFEAYCDMDWHGGGWTLVLMTRLVPGNEQPSNFTYGSQYWDSTAVLNETTTDPTVDQDMKNEAYNSLPFVEVRLDMTTAGNSHILSTTQDSALSLFTGGHVGVTYSRTDFLNWIDVGNSNWNNQPNCNVKGFQITVTGGRCRYGISMNNEGNCSSNDAAIGFGCYTPFNVPLRVISSGGFRWAPDVRYNRRGWIYVR